MEVDKHHVPLFDSTNYNNNYKTGNSGWKCRMKEFDLKEHIDAQVLDVMCTEGETSQIQEFANNKFEEDGRKM